MVGPGGIGKCTRFKISLTINRVGLVALIAKGVQITVRLVYDFKDALCCSKSILLSVKIYGYLGNSQGTELQRNK